MRLLLTQCNSSLSGAAQLPAFCSVLEQSLRYGPLGGAALGVHAGDAERGEIGPGVAVQVTDVTLDQERLGGVREDACGGGQHLDGARLVPAVAAVLHHVLDRHRGPGQGVQGIEQAGLVVLDQEGDRLRRFRGQLPCEVVVTAVTHPLHGCRLRAYALRHVDGVPHLKVELPDGMPGLVAAEATDALGADPAGAGAGLVLDGDGLRRLRAVVVRLRDGDASGPGR